MAVNQPLYSTVLKMCNDTCHDEGTKMGFAASKQTSAQDQTNSQTTETLTKTKTEAPKARMKQERTDTVKHFQNVTNSVREANYSRSSVGEFEQLLDNYDYNLKFRGCKNSAFSLTKHKRYASKRKCKKEFYGPKKSVNKDGKSTPWTKLYDKRKKERYLSRRANRIGKLESHWLMQEECTAEDEDEDEDEMFSCSCDFKLYPWEKFALREDNALEEISDMVGFLLGLQDREITPEDYEFLLRLDESVPTKTVSEERVAGLKTESTRHVDEVCGICMENYVIGQPRKVLLCEHAFHSHCIDMWLTQCSTKCPLDNIEV